MVTDSIADMIVRIKNAGDAGKAEVAVPYSKMKHAIADVLVREGFAKSVAKKGKKVGKFLEIALVFDENGPKIRGFERVSKLSKRVYQKARDIRLVKGGHGILVLTTPKGIVTDREAKKEKVGGEALFKIW